MNITEKQNELVEAFLTLDNDAEMVLTYLIELGNKLPPMDETLKTEDNLVKGCQSKVWLNARNENDRIRYTADSNTTITKGLVSLLVTVLDNQKPEDILTAQLDFVEQAGLSRFFGTQRSNGFAAMIKQFKYYATALSVRDREK